MTDDADHPYSQPLFRTIANGLSVVPFIATIFGPLIAAVWFLPSPWYALGAVPATVVYWLYQRDSMIETMVVLVILVIVAILIRSQILHFRDKIDSKKTTASIFFLLHEVDNAKLGDSGIDCSLTSVTDELVTNDAGNRVRTVIADGPPTLPSMRVCRRL